MRKKNTETLEVLVCGEPYVVGNVNGKMLGLPLKLFYTEDKFKEHCEELKSKGWKLRKGL